MSGAIGGGLTLITGNTGSGKTALCVKMMRDTPERPLFVMGIPELKLEHFKCPPVEEWTVLQPDPDDPSQLLPYFTFPENAIVVIDEAQRIFRPRSNGSKVPDYVAAFETRRHTGVDFVLLT
jgi:zona occludens toxin